MDEPGGGEVPEAAKIGDVEHAESQAGTELADEALDESGDLPFDDVTKGISSIRRLSFSDGEPVELDKTALEAILDVSSRLADIQMRSRMSLSALTQGHETYKDKQVNKRNNN